MPKKRTIKNPVKLKRELLKSIDDSAHAADLDLDEAINFILEDYLTRVEFLQSRLEKIRDGRAILGVF
jgi:hypothetical protein